MTADLTRTYAPRLAEFVSVARANDQLADRIHRFTRRMMRATSAQVALTSLEASLREDFDAFHSVLVLTGGAQHGLACAFAALLSSADTGLTAFLDAALSDLLDDGTE